MPLVLALVLPAAVHAQVGTAASLMPLRNSEEVIVTQSASAQELRGFLVELSSTTLAMLVDGKRVEVPMEGVLRIDGRNDSVKNGAAIGASVMGGLSALVCAQEYVGGALCVTNAIMYVGLGALVGAGVDALHKGRTTIYSKPSSVSLAVAPAGKGATAQLRLRW
jgi:hypothetical protein